MESASEIIPKSAFADGLVSCEENGKKLLQNANSALRRNAYECAFILGFTAFEEFGKALLLVKYWNKDYITRKAWKKEFLSHRIKTHQAKITSDKLLLVPTAMLPEDTKILVDEEFLGKLRNVRNICLHVDFDFKEKVWKKPIDLGDTLRVWALTVIMTAIDAEFALQKEKEKIV